MASSFSPVRVKAATQEAAIEQAIHMTGATRADMEIEVLEETEKGVTIRVAPIGSASAAAQTAPSAAPVQNADFEDVQSEEIHEEGTSTPALEELDDEDDDDDEEFENESAPVEAASETVRVAPEVRHASDEMKEHACAIADEILERMGLEARAEMGDLPNWCLPTSHEKNERARDVPRAFMKIEGEDVGILIGKHGNTLQSFQYLLNLTLNNAPDENASEEGVRDGGIHVVVDAGEYRDRRAGALERQALDAAARAKRDRRSVRLDPMPGHERRLVHLALYDDKEIATSSEGREPWRRVVIAPAGMRVESRDESGQGRREYSGGGNSGGGRGYGNRGGNSGGYGSSGNSGGYGGRGGQSGYGGNSGGSGGNRGYGNSGGGSRGAGRGR